MRIIITLILALTAYFGATYWVELKNPEIAKLTSDPLKQVATTTESSAAEKFIGSFAIDTKISTEWLNGEASLNHESRAYFAKRHQVNNSFHFDGSTFYFGDNPELAAEVEILKEADDSIELRILDATLEHDGSLNFYLQTNGNGQFWYSNYSHMQGGKRQLYRACYTKL